MWLVVLCGAYFVHFDCGDKGYIEATVISKTQLPLIQYQLPMIKYQLPMIQYKLPTIQYQIPMIKTQLPVIKLV